MNIDLCITLGLLFLCIIAFIFNRPRVDIVALIAFVALPALGVIKVEDALNAFSDSSVLIIAMMFIISAGLMRTGVSYRLGNIIVKYAGDNQIKLTALLMITVASIGTVMSTTGVVAIFVPIVLNICSRLKIPPAKLMMPLGFAGIISGMTTLVATSPNLILNGAMVREGFESFGFFDITPIGIIVLVLGILYIIYMQRFLGASGDSAKINAPRLTFYDFIRDYDLASRERIFRVEENSILIGKTLGELTIRNDFGANIVCIERQGRLERRLVIPSSEVRLVVGDILLVDMYSVDIAEELAAKLGLRIESIKKGYFINRSSEMGMIEIVISPESTLIGKNLIDSQFRSKYMLHAIGLRRNSAALKGDIYSHKLRMGDILLLIGPWKNIRHMNVDSKEFMVLNIPEEYDIATSAPGRAPFAILSLAVMLGIMLTGILPNVIAVFIACLLLLIFKCIDIDKAYAAIHWPALILIIGMMPFAVALDKTGGIDAAAKILMELFGGLGTRGTLLGLCIITMCVGLFISNTVTAVLMAPLAIAAAEAESVSPYPFVMSISIAASTAFMTPFSSPVNMLVMSPGRYKFADFIKVGVPFAAIVTAVNVTVVPMLFPF